MGEAACFDSSICFCCCMALILEFTMSSSREEMGLMTASSMDFGCSMGAPERLIMFAIDDIDDIGLNGMPTIPGTEPIPRIPALAAIGRACTAFFRVRLFFVFALS